MSLGGIQRPPVQLNPAPDLSSELEANIRRYWRTYLTQCCHNNGVSEPCQELCTFILQSTSSLISLLSAFLTWIKYLLRYRRKPYIYNSISYNLLFPVALPEDVTTCRVVGNVACHVPHCVKSACDQDLDYIFVLRGRCRHLAATRPRGCGHTGGG